MVPNVKTSFSTLNREGIERLVCIPPILVGASHEVGVASLMKRILEACNWRLTVCEGGCAVNDRGLLQILTFLLMMMEMAITGSSRGLPPVSLSCVMRITTIGADIKAHLAKAWETML